MPNNTGGKNYKKKKHAEPEPVLHELLAGQMYARVIKKVGGCNVIVFSNDGIERICHIRGNMRRKVWLDVGDIVLISLRDLDASGTTPQRLITRGDICAKYDQRVIHRLQEKDPSINPKLFTSLEKADDTGKVPDETGFVFSADFSDDDDAPPGRNVIANGHEESDSEDSKKDFNIDDI